MRWMSVLLVVLALGACKRPAHVGVFHSSGPLFRPRMDQRGPPLRPGLWLREDPDCRLDERQEAGAWPVCADWISVRRDLFIHHVKGDPADRFRTDFYIVMNLDPPLLQLAVAGAEPGYHWYQGLRPLAFDEAGQVVRARFWNCETLESPAPRRTPVLPDHCAVGSSDALRTALKAAEHKHDLTFRWVRDGEY
jgi:hypothetical protein